MPRMTHAVSLFALGNLVFALTIGEVAAQTIAVTPAAPTIAVGQRQQFTATGGDTVTGLDAGAFHTCAVLQDASLRCWGLNDYGHLGDGTRTDSASPVAVTGITNAAAVSGGGYHTCALLADGTVRCWGRNSGEPNGIGGGQLGDPGTDAFFSASPVPVTGLTDATAVSAGGFHTCALLADGTVRCWGQNDQGQLGNGILDPPGLPPRNSTPVTVSGITTAIAVSAGGWHTCALLANGTVRCWGDNERGAVGDGSPTPTPFTRRPTPTPVEVVGITTAVAIESGFFHTCATLRDGRMQCWGWNSFWQLGDTSAINASATPVTVPGISPTALAPGAEHTCVLLAGGRANCWGDNNNGALGNGSPRGVFAPPTADVTGINAAIAVSSGAEHTCTVLPAGTVQCWGAGLFGRLGDGSSGVGPAWGACGPDGQSRCAFTPVSVMGVGVTWTSSDESVATIDAAGLATGRRAGSTTITATSGDRAGSTTLTVGTRPSLSVVRQGPGIGTVTSSPAGIDCGGSCTASYDVDTVVTLTATPAAGSTFTGWTGGGCSGTGLCRVTLTANTVVTARFDIPRFTLSVNRAGNGTVTSSPAGISCGTTCSASYDRNTVVTLTATPAAGFTFAGWTGGGCSGTGPCRVTLTANTVVTARFDIPRVTLSVNRTGNGTVTSSPAGISCGTTCSASYDRNTVVTLTATPAAGFTFAGWTGGGCSGTGPCRVTLTANTVVTARFDIQRFRLSVNRTGNGTVTSSPAGISCGATCSATYNSGTAVTLRATPGFLSVFVGWSGGGCSGTGPCTVILRGNTTVTATFRILGIL